MCVTALRVLEATESASEPDGKKFQTGNPCSEMRLPIVYGETNEVLHLGSGPDPC